ncbi:transposase family protein, partial [Escherichia coli]|nr:transposase family protein [Escherichia coli]EFW6871364.1 transposase family protein [Shigella sonnei]EKB6281249.1 transposase family protein [Escherichia coli]ELI2306543.1 transposase family protein [Escherichia coli]HEC5135758.1 transposase family protein [Escherichia coli]
CNQHLACQPRERVVALECHSICKLIFTPRPSRCAYVDGRKLYLSPIMDLYNGEIVSYNLTERPLASMVKSMLLDAVEQLNKDDKPLLHSDQGWQYQMPRWQRWLSDNGITQSMSRRGNCLDNAAMESFFSTLK